MRITERIEETVSKEITKDIFCNKCEKSILVQHILTPAGCEAKFVFHYGSIYDDTVARIHLCDSCWDEFKSSCKIKPEERDTTFDWKSPFKPEW